MIENLIDPHLQEKKQQFPDHKQWTTGINKRDNRVYIQDDNFEYDARLYINGDFPDIETQLEYANQIARILNESTSK